MTEISFHFNAQDKLRHACRVLRKAHAQGVRVAVTGEVQLLDRLDAALWTFSSTDFVPHCLGHADAAMLAASAVILSPDLQGLPQHQVLLNLGGEVPDGFERFERLIEVVTHDDGDRQLARRRWKHYADRGYAIVRHDLKPTEPAA